MGELGDILVRSGNMAVNRHGNVIDDGLHQELLCNFSQTGRAVRRSYIGRRC